MFILSYEAWLNSVPPCRIPNSHVHELFITWKTEQGMGYLNLNSLSGLEKIIVMQRERERRREGEREEGEER